ncbi:MAG TPA: hypothetical protein VFU21_14855, partial [Kofleriaceae bacterium]|nr:hypothetical protein [Kofleriaceae bacterium]
GEMLQVHGAAARYLETSHGATSRAEIAGALRAASETGQVVLRRGVRFRAGNEVQLADLRVRRIEAPDPLAGLFLVSFLPGGHPAAPPADPVALRQELEIMNQELSSMNDELRAANLDLESSLEAVNQRLDDLEAANAELTGRLAELSPDQAR